MFDPMADLRPRCGINVAKLKLIGGRARNDENESCNR